MKIGLLVRQASDIAAWSRQACDEAGGDRVPQYDDDWDDRCRLLCRDRRASTGDNDIDLEPNKLGRDLCEPAGASIGPAILDREVATLYPTEFAQPLHKSGSPWSPGQGRGRAKKSDGRQVRWLLRPRRERPCRRAANQRNEPTPPQVKHGAAPSRRSAAPSAYHRPDDRSLGLDLNCSESRLSTLRVGQPAKIPRLLALQSPAGSYPFGRKVPMRLSLCCTHAVAEVTAIAG